MRYFGGGIGHLGQASSHIHWKHASGGSVENSGESLPQETEALGEIMEDSDEELDSDDDRAHTADNALESDGDF